ncbi:MAG: trypsin-like serine protease [Polyangiales bacterium]
MSLHKTHTVILASLMPLLGACGDPGPSDVEAVDAAIVGGWAATTEQIFATVEIRSAGAKSGFCSGVLISPSVVATAAHCAVVEHDEGDVYGAAPGTLRVVAGHLSSASAAPENVRIVIEVRIHEDYDHDFIMGRSRSGAGKGGIGSPNDLALLFLSEPFDSVANAPMVSQQDAEDLVRHGDLAYVAGYGVYDVERDLSGELYISDAIIDVLGQRELLTRRPDQLGDSCFGDSGGPLYLPTDHGDILVGLVSRGRSDVPNDCGDGGVYTMLSAYLPWIEHAAGKRLAPRIPPDSIAIAFRPDGQEYVPPTSASLERVQSCAATRTTQVPGFIWVVTFAVLLARRRRFA